MEAGAMEAGAGAPADTQPSEPVNPVALAAEARFHVTPVPVEQPLHPVVDEGKWKFHTALETELLDWKHNNAMQIEACANTLIRIFSNVLEHPDEDKYRRVKAASAAFKAITNVKGGEHLITLAGWKPEVIDLVRYWVFDGQPGSHKHAIMHESNRLLQKAIALIHEKAERKRSEAEEKAAAEKARLAKVKAALDEDRAERMFRNQQAALARQAQAVQAGEADMGS